jgi:hypothetical protein
MKLAIAILSCLLLPISLARAAAPSYQFDGKISREVLENYLSRSITIEGMLHGRGDLDDNLAMVRRIGAKYLGRSVCLWSREANFNHNMELARAAIPKVHAIDPDIICEACVFEIVTTQVDQLAIPDWAFKAFDLPVEKRNFKYADMIYTAVREQNRWRGGSSVPDVSRPETQLYFYFQAVSYIDAGCEAIHFGQVELMNHNDRDSKHWVDLLTRVRAYAAEHARRHLVLCNGHVPDGGLVRDGHLVLDFHAFPLRIHETPDKPGTADLQLGFSDGIYGRSKGGIAPSGWSCEHLPYLVELDNFGVSRTPGKAGAGTIWVWGYDEISWFAHQPPAYRAEWLQYAWDWLKKNDPNAYLEMPGGRTMAGAVNGKRWYSANNPTEKTPGGLSDEAGIRAVWDKDAAGHP